MHIIFDIGGTKLRLAFSEDGENFEEPYVVRTPPAFEDGMKAIKEGFEKISRGRNVKISAGGIRGVLNKEKDTLLGDVHLKGWIEKPIKNILQEIFGSEVLLGNDTALVGLGEATKGAGKNFNIVAYITISTGVGGARIIGGKVDESVLGFEPGHQIIDVDGTIFPEALSLEGGGVKGHLESYISGTALKKRFGKDPWEISDPKVWDDEAKYLAVGLNNTIVHWSPDVVVLGGGMMKSPGISVDAVRMYLANILKIFPVTPEIKKAELEDFGGLHGALEYIKSIAN